MAKARFTFVVLLLLSWTAVPALRCLVASETLTPEEQACCKTMGGQCGEMGSHPCCKKVQSSTQPAVATTKTSIIHFAVIDAQPVSAIEGVSFTITSYAPAEPYPPPSPGVSTTILRI